MKVETVKITKIKPYEKNPRRNDDAVEAVANSIRTFGWQQPIVVDADGVIIAGHTRYKAAKHLGLKEVPVVYADLDEDKARAYRIADNSTNSLADWDYDLLLGELEGIDLDMGDFGLDLGDVAAQTDTAVDIIEDEPPEVDTEHEPTVKRGQIYRLGGHFLMCGDASIPEDLKALMYAGGGKR